MLLIQYNTKFLACISYNFKQRWMSLLIILFRLSKFYIYLILQLFVILLELFILPLCLNIIFQVLAHVGEEGLLQKKTSRAREIGRAVANEETLTPGEITRVSRCSPTASRRRAASRRVNIHTCQRDWRL